MAERTSSREDLSDLEALAHWEYVRPLGRVWGAVDAFAVLPRGAVLPASPAADSAAHVLVTFQIATGEAGVPGNVLRRARERVRALLTPAAPRGAAPPLPPPRLDLVHVFVTGNPGVSVAQRVVDDRGGDADAAFARTVTQCAWRLGVDFDALVRFAAEAA